MHFAGNFIFESYGVFVKLESNSPELLQKGKETASKALLGRIKIVENRNTAVDHTFGLNQTDDGRFFMVDNGSKKSNLEDTVSLFSYFNSILRLTIAEKATSNVFVHAGVVGLKGKALVLPAFSYQGKTTLVAELVKNGAEYFSDEYAVFDEQGLVHPFERDLSVRTENSILPVPVSIESIGGKVASGPAPVGMVFITEYREDAVWEPEILTLGRGLMEIIPQVIPIRFNTEFSLKLLNTALSHAIIAKCPRGEAGLAAKLILSFFESNLN